MDTGWCVGGGGGREGREDGGGPSGSGGVHGGKCISCTCPICRPGIANSVEYAAVASVSRPNEEYVLSFSPNSISTTTLSDKLTSWVITGVPFRISGYYSIQLKHNYSSPECNRQPTSPACKPSYPLSELEFRHFLTLSVVPQYDLVRWVSWATTTS
ncbi:unnamed protein product [Somion occarium]|uniref:Uncharacterized protein n=1 Tax=Somion occarium TaxID=3059160 RepID=A0ABP1D0J1_9APHY